MMSGVALDQVKIMQDAPGVARGRERARSSPPKSSSSRRFRSNRTGTDANVQVRGVSANVMSIRRKNVKIVEGRMFNPGLSELDRRQKCQLHLLRL